MNIALLEFLVREVQYVEKERLVCCSISFRYPCWVCRRCSP